MSRPLLVILSLTIISLAVKDIRCHNSFNFLEDNENFNISDETTVSFDLATADPVSSFVRGFNDGLGLFNNLPHRDECNPNNPSLIQDLRDVIQLLQNITVTTNFRKLFNELREKAKHITETLSEISAECREYSKEVKAVLRKLNKHVAHLSYFLNLFNHTTHNFKTIAEKIKKATVDAVTENAYEAGKSNGDLLKYVLFWDF